MGYISHILLIVILTCIATTIQQTCTTDDEQFLITFHPHLDAFWLNIDTQLKNIDFKPAGFLYNMNQRNSKTILNSMVEALTKNYKRKYFITQTVFFKDWYDYLTSDKKQQVKVLLASGQLEIVNGAWVQNDQAVCYYDDILDQYTLGHSFLYNQFNYQTKIGWATDSFGHSHSQAALQHVLGIQFQGIQRVDDRYVNEHFDKPLLQFYWSPVSDSNNLTYGGVLNHVRHFLHQVNDYRRSSTSLIANDFRQIQQVMKSKYYLKNKLFRFLGNDFEQFIPLQFENLEKTMNQLNMEKSSSCQTFKYGNPSDYLQLITKYYEKNNRPTRKWDFMPNWDQDRYWTGYYTTDPHLKKVCKDFSRLVNFYRKSLLMLGNYNQYKQKLNQAEQLLAVLQHHDGITATSKTYIQDQFRNRISKKTTDIINTIGIIHGGSDAIICRLHQNHNQCKIPDSRAAGPPIQSLHIITHGGSKKQKIQIVLPSNTYYDIEEVQEDIFCDDGICVLVFEAALHPGVNKFTFLSKMKYEISHKIFEIKIIDNLSYNGRDISIKINKTSGQIQYAYGDDEYFIIGLYDIDNKGYSRQSVWWNKYGRKVQKSQYISPGMYIMANDGKIKPFPAPAKILKVAEGRIFKRIYATISPSIIKITIKNDQPNIMDVIHQFRPESRSEKDYFMKVSSTVKHNTLYHDSNGFLVAKRILNSRPDYEYSPNLEDQINGNTYPTCTFAYLLQNSKKFLFFTDRAQGVAAYKGDLLINFDRLIMDDGKGVGSGYGKVVSNTFRYKFALIAEQDDTQRVWQKSYDEALIGFLTDTQGQAIKYTNIAINQISHIPGNGPINYLKYSIFFVSANQYVIRFQNLAEFTHMMVSKPTGNKGSYEWNIQQLGLKLKFFDFKDSYANGIPKQTKWRRHWNNQDQTEINLFTKSNQEGNKFLLRPLEIRSFRINLRQEIIDREKRKSIIHNNNQIGQKDLEPKGKLRKRCF